MTKNDKNLKKCYSEEYYRKRKDRLGFLIGFSKWPETTSAREALSQMNELAELERNEAGEELYQIR